MADTAEDVPTTGAAPPATDGAAEEAPKKVVKKVARPSESKRDAAVGELQTKVDEMLTELVSGARVAVRHVTSACRSVPRFGRDLAAGGTRVVPCPAAWAACFRC